MKSVRWIVTCAAIVLTVGVAARAESPAQERGRVAEEHLKFDDHDRSVVLDWYGRNTRSLPVGLRDRDRLSHDLELKFAVGVVLDRDMRGRIHDAPRDLIRLLPVAPRGYRYVLLGGHLCLIDGRYEVRDIIHLGHDR